jgi:methylase of polypeptide subunit release factors
MDILHHAFKVLFDTRLLYFEDRVRKDLNRVLDVGTGTGKWAIEFADAYPGASVVGLDQSPIQPTWVSIPITPLLC